MKETLKPAAECLRAFAVVFELCGRDADYDLRNRLCLMMGISERTGHAWFEKMIMPVGVNRLRLLVLLELAGFPTEERNLSPIARDLGELLALSGITPDGVAEFLDTTANTVLRWAFGTVQPSTEKETLLRAYLRAHKESVGEQLAGWKETLRTLGIINHTSEVFEEKATTVPLDKEQVLAMLAHFFLASIPLVEKVLSDEFTPEDRERLRQLTHVSGRVHHGVFILSNGLAGLCGERARKETR